MSKQDPERRLELSPAQVAGSALAAMSGAAVISWAGTAGTLIGAAAGSVIATVGAATYTYSLQRTRDAAKLAAARVRQTALITNASARTVAQGPMREGDDTAPPADLDAESPESPESAERRRWDLPWGKVALASLAVMVAALAGITAIEAATGRSLSSYTGGGDNRSTLGSVVGSDEKATPERSEKKSPPVKPTEESTPTVDPHDGATDAPAEPEPTTPATPDPTTDPDPTPTVPPVETGDPDPENTLP